MSMDNIKNKSAVITGAARGLGYAFAQILLQNGARVVAILDLTSSSGQASAATLEKEFGKGRAVFFPCDVSNREQFKETFRRVVNAFKGVDIFINNAGVYDELNWERTLRINVGGVIHGSLLAIDHMGKHKGGKGGIVVNISSLAGLLNLPISPVYSSVKQNVISFSQCLQASFETTGVHVMVLCPGLTETTITDDASMKSFDFIDFASWMEKLNAASHQKQSVGNVARALVTLIQKGENGAVWVTENEQPPYGIDFPPISTVDLHL
ncbi:15-hydroxyprostaglandin dehydrogenase [NAD(+)]-like isoform X1 [Colletes gigas]|uniref:15-hydroxyprostaglandin dehydrogenase [NAD(+)]-like isoform X1 n=2 Tax=Colletes gigas TaxID=935657 RepID=UPI001C9A6F2C|nr:15-hydroxyprostaglandin dehydrogenase [NAD(+)]-like isoform X1 [Colletes gigas]